MTEDGKRQEVLKEAMALLMDSNTSSPLKAKALSLLVIARMEDFWSASPGLDQGVVAMSLFQALGLWFATGNLTSSKDPEFQMIVKVGFEVMGSTLDEIRDIGKILNEDKERVSNEMMIEIDKLVSNHKSKS